MSGKVPRANYARFAGHGLSLWFVFCLRASLLLYAVRQIKLRPLRYVCRDQLVEPMYGTHAMARVCGGMSGADIATRAIRPSASVGGGTEGEVYRLEDADRRLDMAIKVYFIIDNSVTETDALVQLSKDYMMNRRLGQAADVVDIGTSITSVETRCAGSAMHINRRISQKVSVPYPHSRTCMEMKCLIKSDRVVTKCAGAGTSLCALPWIRIAVFFAPAA